jgi:hypothetical protein
MALEELSRPLAVIDTLFARHTSEGSLAPEFGEHAHFKKMLNLDNEEGLARIPCVNDVELADTIPPFSLVRYRCLVQDVFEPECYAAVFQEVDEGTGAPVRLITSKYRECIEPTSGRLLQELDGHRSLSQRGACYCVPLPGESQWARSAAVEWTLVGGGAIQPNAAIVTSGTTKRRRPDEDVSMEPEAEVTQRPRVDQVAAGKLCQPCGKESIVGTQIGETLKTAEDFGLNLPIPSEERRGQGASTACIVKLYDEDAEILRLCDSIEVIGVLCINPDIADLQENGDMADDWRDARHPSTSLVPRLHALAVRRLPFHHPLLPFSPSFLAEDRLAAAFQRQFAAQGTIVAARNAALQQLVKHLGGDALSAEYLFVLLASRSFSTHGELLLGKWSLNLAGWPQSLDTRALRDAGRDCATRCAFGTDQQYSQHAKMETSQGLCRQPSRCFAVAACSWYLACVG